jgi:hypothetical protein
LSWCIKHHPDYSENATSLWYLSRYQGTTYTLNTKYND